MLVVAFKINHKMIFGTINKVCKNEIRQTYIFVENIFMSLCIFFLSRPPLNSC